MIHMSPEDMKKSTKAANSVWMALIQEKNRSSSKPKLFCFYEGEDFKYYKRRINKIFSEADLISYVCDGKNNVLKLYRKIKQEEKSIKEYLFFIDKDYDTGKPNTDIFQTPFHSIENFYTVPLAVTNILEDKFDLHPIDIDNLSTMYDKLYKEYLNIYKNVAAWYLACCEIKYPIELDKNYKVLAYIDIKNDKINLRQENISDIATVGKCIEKKLSEEDLKEYRKYYPEILNIAKSKIQSLDIQTNSRGKFDFDFLSIFLKYVISLNKKKLLTKFYKHINIDHLFSADPLQSLSVYAITPQELISYIRQHEPVKY